MRSQERAYGGVGVIADEADRLALAVSLVFIVAGFWRPDMDAGGTFEQVVYFFSVPLHFRSAFSRGLLDTRPLILYASVTVFFLFLTVRSLESRRWR